MAQSPRGGYQVQKEEERPSEAAPRIPGPLAPWDVTGKLFGDKPNAKSAASKCGRPLKPQLPPRAKPYARVRQLPVTRKRSPRHGRAMPRK